VTTSVRYRSGSRQPVAYPHLTVGDHVPTGLALAGAGKLAAIARAMGRSEAWIYKAAQGERGPERELADVFAAMHSAGVPEPQARLLLERLEVAFAEAYHGAAYRLAELWERETWLDTEEDRAQLAVLQRGSAEDLARYQAQCEALAALYRVMAAACRRELLRRGVL
jgi:hypothetical protein